MKRSAGESLRIGIIGGGSIAAYHVNGLRAAGGVEIAAIAARSLESAALSARALGVGKACAGWRELLAPGDLDAVIIATPDDTHEEIGVAALNAGVDVLLQKPMALTSASCRTILAAAKGAGRRVFVSFMHRHFPEVEAARRLIADPGSGLGEPLSARLRNATPGPDWGSWFFAKPHTGVVMQLGVHGIDLAEHMFGPIREVSARIGLQRKERRMRDGSIIRPANEDHALAIYGFESGLMMSHEMCFTELAGTDRFALEIVTEQGVLHLRGPRGALAWRREGDADWRIETFAPEPFGFRQHDAFLKMLRGEAPHDGSDLAGLHGVMVAEAIYSAAASGRLTPAPEISAEAAG